MLNGFTQWPHLGFLFLHMTDVCQVVFSHLSPSGPFFIRQDLCRLVDPPIGALEWRPERSRGLQPFGQQALQLL
jgi:hypothetical protein